MAAQRTYATTQERIRKMFEVQDVTESDFKSIYPRELEVIPIDIIIGFVKFMHEDLGISCLYDKNLIITDKKCSIILPTYHTQIIIDNYTYTHTAVISLVTDWYHECREKAQVCDDSKFRKFHYVFEEMMKIFSNIIYRRYIKERRKK